MSVVTVEDFKAIATQFNEIPDSKTQFWLDISENYHCPIKVWGDRQRDGIIVLTQHFLTMDLMQAAETAGTAVGLASGNGGRAPSNFDNDLNLTHYGRQFQILRRGLGTTTGFAL